MKTIAFFNNKGGVGKTTLVYHIAWMLAELGQRVLAADLDPQANLSSMFLEEERLEELKCKSSSAERNLSKWLCLLRKSMKRREDSSRRTKNSLSGTITN